MPHRFRPSTDSPSAPAFGSGATLEGTLLLLLLLDLLLFSDTLCQPVPPVTHNRAADEEQSRGLEPTRRKIALR